MVVEKSWGARIDAVSTEGGEKTRGPKSDRSEADNKQQTNTKGTKEMKEKQAKKTDNYDLTCLCLLDPEKRMRTVNELELSCAKTIQAAFIQMDRIREWDKNIKEWGKKQQNSTKGKTKNE